LIVPALDMQCIKKILHARSFDEWVVEDVM